MTEDNLVERVTSVKRIPLSVRNYGLAFAISGLVALYFGLTNLSKRKELAELKANPPYVERTVPKGAYEALQARKNELEDSIARSEKIIRAAKKKDYREKAIEEYDAETDKIKEKLNEHITLP